MTNHSNAALPAWSDGAGIQSIAQVVSNVRKATFARTGFAAFMATFSTVVLPWQIALAWFAFMAAWELAIRIALEDRVVLPAAARSQRVGAYWLAAVHFVGANAYTLYPFLVWATGEPVGMVLATAWVCGSANHLFVYFAANRLLLISCITPLAIVAVAAPLTTGGLAPETAAATATFGALILSAGMFGLDRRVLLGSLAKQAAARAEAEQANAAKSQFLATMSHELRTPLNAVIGYAELIEEDTDGPVREDAGKIRGSARQLLGVIDVILDISKLETGSIQLNPEPTEISAVLEQLREAALPLAAANGNTLTIEEAGALGEAELDHARLYQCLMQLISNAAKFTRDGALKVTASRQGERLSFAVSDTGIGISETQQAQIFEPFMQADGDAARRYEGAGLGLTLVQRLARLMGGDVSVQSRPGEGSTFTLWVAAPAVG